MRLRVLQPEALHLERWLESGKLDFAMGSFPSIPEGIRRQRLWVERYVSVARSGHPRLASEPTMRAFAAEKHVLVSTAGAGHAHQVMQRALEAVIPRENVVCQVPIFIGAAVLAKYTDAIATLPLSVVSVLSKDLDLQIIKPRSDSPVSIFVNIGTSGFIVIRVTDGSGRFSERCSEDLLRKACRRSTPARLATNKLLRRRGPVCAEEGADLPHRERNPLLRLLPREHAHLRVRR